VTRTAACPGAARFKVRDDPSLAEPVRELEFACSNSAHFPRSAGKPADLLFTGRSYIQTSIKMPYTREKTRSAPRASTRAVSLIVALLLILSIAQAQDTPGGEPAQPGTFADSSTLFYPLGSSVRIRAYDVLRVKVFDVSELSGDYTVNPAGSISLPLVTKPIQAQGRTPADLARDLSNELRAEGLVSTPVVTIEVKKSRLHSVVIGGAVKKPQVYPLFDHITLLDLLAEAGGLSSDAGEALIITRPRSQAACASGVSTTEAGCGHQPSAGRTEAPVQITIALRELLDRSNPSLNLDLYPGDAVTVEYAGVVYVVGAVNRAGGFPLTNDREHMTVLKALALAEGLTSTAIRKHSLIIRQNSDNSRARREISVNLSSIFDGKAPDPALHANDILFVPDSTSRKALRRAAEAAVEITTGVIIFR
jgi:polysaccharide biosynthesis/export protein